jgi:Family of unknown function (DUF6069)
MTAATVAPSRLRIRGRRLLVVVAAALAALLVWAVLTAITGDLTVRQPGATGYSTVTAGAVVVSALFAGFAGWGLLALFERFFGPAHRVWRIVGAITLVVSLAAPLGGADTTAKLSLVALHLVVGGTILAGLPGPARRREAAS